MATPQENTLKRMATDILVALIHNNRLVPPHHDDQNELAMRQTELLTEAYNGLLEMLKLVKIKEASNKRLAADILIAAIHANRFHPNLVAPEDIVPEQIRVLTQAYQNIIDSFTNA